MVIISFFLQLELLKYRKDPLLSRTNSSKDSMSKTMTCTANIHHTAYLRLDIIRSVFL